MTCTLPFTPTVEGFQALFYRDFNYIYDWDVATTYNAGDIVFYTFLIGPNLSQKFYKCLNNGVIGGLPTDANWEEVPYSTSISQKYVTSSDIERAFDEASNIYNPALFCEENQVMMFYYLSAHFLTRDIGASGNASSGSGEVSSKSADNVSISYTIPQWALKNPAFSFLAATYYGQKYLASAYSASRGSFGAVAGGTTPF